MWGKRAARDRGTPMIVVQQIRISSTDPSLVGPHTQRSWIPEAVAIPFDEREYADCVLLQHMLGYSARLGLPERVSETVSGQMALPRTTSQCVVLEPSDDQLRVTFSYNPTCGAPNRWWAVK